MQYWPLALILALPGVALAQTPSHPPANSSPSPVGAEVLPAQVQASPRSLVTLSPKTESDVAWGFPAEISPRDIGTCPDGKVVFLVSPAAKGTYAVHYAYSDGGKVRLAKCLLVVDDFPEPGPPVPPGPKPPVPPQPPAPTDPLEAELLAAYKVETAATKRDTLSKLSALYKVAAGYAMDPDFQTVGDFAEAVRKASGSLVGTGLQPFRTRVGAEIGKTLGTNAAVPLTPELRDAAAKLFARLNAICESLLKQ